MKAIVVVLLFVHINMLFRWKITNFEPEKEIGSVIAENKAMTDSDK